ncbi:MAG: HEAT repeat domain-containing protein [Planctomycetota bacterium]|nr:HEAT repeat domain-containing protein [Planctomycetota bacterium]
MPKIEIMRKHLALVSALLLPALSFSTVTGQDVTEDMVGQTSESWALWQETMRVVQLEDADAAGARVDQILALGLSDLRLALMADRTGSGRLEQSAERDAAGDNIKTIVEHIKSGRRQRQLAEDGWHFSAIGRFEYADANFKALAESDPDPVALLELARQNPNRHLILVKLVANEVMGPAAQQMIGLLDEGEARLRRDPYEISLNVQKLAGTPRTVHRATNALKNSGEYAIPHLIQSLRDARQSDLHAAIIRVLPKIGRSGLNPMCQALGISDGVVKQVLIDALGQIGYRQAIPYLAKLAHDGEAEEDVRAVARSAIRTLGSSLDRDVSLLFYELAEHYYDGEESMQADANMDEANVWYLKEDRLIYQPVPTVIFNDVMAMRSVEEALTANAGNTEATALWLAANFRREAKLGLDVESDQADVLAAKDGTRPEGYPRSIYFARAAGPMYNHLVLARAVRDREAGPALGSIAALSATAGEPSLVGAENIKQPLVQALAFPNRQVRIKTALAIGLALPTRPFAQSHNVMPVLSEALMQSGRKTAMVVDPEDETRNKMVGLLRAAGVDCAVGSTVFEAASDGDRSNISSFDLIVIASDIGLPGHAAAIDDLRKNFNTAATPILILTKAPQMNQAIETARVVEGAEVVFAEVLSMGDPAEIERRVMGTFERASLALGMMPLSEALSASLALRSARVLRQIAANGRTVFDFNRAAPALITALENRSGELRIESAHTLALAALPEAQTAICEAALNGERAVDERVRAFGSLAESARRNGNLLGDDLVQRVIGLTMDEKDLVLQAAASKALGALDLPSNKASEIIRAQSRG